jgi:hypothetical protein
MAKSNPMAGGPDYIKILCGALKQRASTYSRPPATGGTQFSLRLREDRLALLERLVERSGWNRNQIVDALIDNGLFMLFDELSNATADEIMEDHAEKFLKAKARRN